jgi:hypothetical protein
MRKKIPNSIKYNLGGQFSSDYWNNGQFGSDIGNTFQQSASLASTGASVAGPYGAAAGAIIGLSTGLGKMYNNTKFGQSKLGKAAGFAINPIVGISNLVNDKKRKEQEEIQDQLEEQQRSQITQQNMSVINSLMTPSNMSNLPMAMGGDMNQTSTLNPVGTFTEFNNGGSHEINPLGGIPQGYNSDGQMRMVEENESKYKFKEGNYIFSDRLKYE